MKASNFIAQQRKEMPYQKLLKFKNSPSVPVNIYSFGHRKVKNTSKRNLPSEERIEASRNREREREIWV